MPRWAGIKQVLKHWSCTSNQVQMIMTTKIQKMTKIRAWNMVCFCTIRYLFLWSGFLHREIASNIQVVFLQKGPKMFVKIIKNIFPFSCIIGNFLGGPKLGVELNTHGEPRPAPSCGDHGWSPNVHCRGTRSCRAPCLAWHCWTCPMSQVICQEG